MLYVSPPSLQSRRNPGTSDTANSGEGTGPGHIWARGDKEVKALSPNEQHCHVFVFKDAGIS